VLLVNVRDKLRVHLIDLVEPLLRVPFEERSDETLASHWFKSRTCVNRVHCTSDHQLAIREMIAAHEKFRSCPDFVALFEKYARSIYRCKVLG